MSVVRTECARSIAAGDGFEVPPIGGGGLRRERSQYGVARVRGCFENAETKISSVKCFVSLDSTVKDTPAIAIGRSLSERE
jgi:hypothetical protein